MPTMLIMIILGVFLVAGLFVVSQWERYRIKHSGTLVTAKVTRVDMWQEPLSPDLFFRSNVIPPLGGRWRYEIHAEWTDPHTENTYVFSSGIKTGLPEYQRGDYLAAYVSPYGTYLELSSAPLRM